MATPRIVINHKLTEQELENKTVTIGNIPVGKVTFRVLANEAALGKDYDTVALSWWDVPGPHVEESLADMIPTARISRNASPM